MLYVIAEHRVRVSFLDDYQDAKMLSSFVSFQTDDDGSAVLLDITVDDSLRPVKKDERYLIRDVDTGNGMTKVFRVEKEVDGQNKKLIMSNDDFVLISRRKYNEVIDKLNQFISGRGV